VTRESLFPSFDPVTFIAVPVVLMLAAVLACVAPARRAAGIDPIRGSPHNARTVCNIGTQPVIPPVYGVNVPLYGDREE